MVVQRKFVLSFEPERVNPNSRIAREHPELPLRVADGDGLCNLGNTDARRWLTDHFSKRIADWSIDVCRNDFHIDPLPFQQDADARDRQGMAEIRYVEGHYAMGHELRKRRPGLAIDNCAGGGRSIDLETISRSFPLWRSDTQCCGRPMAVQDQVQTAGIRVSRSSSSGSPPPTRAVARVRATSSSSPARWPCASASRTST